jgi:hypothetical protein
MTAERGCKRLSCHLTPFIWRRQIEILKEEHGITWYSPREMNPSVIYD